jgi:glycosyltransferase involved in cell wall biosynthesis
MHVSLIVPAPFDLVSGGYGYDRRIVAEMRASGLIVDVVELTGSFPFADDLARQNAGAAWNGLKPGTKVVIDGLALPAFHGIQGEVSARGSVGLIHHPVSMETGQAATARDALANVEQRFFPLLTRLIVTSDTTAETLITRFHVPPERVSIVVPGTDDATRSPVRNSSVCKILSIGTLIPRKGHDVLLRALASLRDLNWHLTIVGSPDRDPPHARALMTLAEDLKIADRVRFAGEQVGEALDHIWSAADLFALTTHYEGYGMVIAEALKRGLPVVITEGGAAGALVTDRSGVVCPVGDHVHVANALRRLITGGDERRQMADRAWRAGQTLPSWRDQAALFAAALI